jgi:hypothetical protein
MARTLRLMKALVQFGRIGQGDGPEKSGSRHQAKTGSAKRKSSPDHLCATFRRSRRMRKPISGPGQFQSIGAAMSRICTDLR